MNADRDNPGHILKEQPIVPLMPAREVALLLEFGLKKIHKLVRQKKLKSVQTIYRDQGRFRRGSKRNEGFPKTMGGAVAP